MKTKKSAEQTQAGFDEEITLFEPHISTKEAYAAMLYEYGRSSSWLRITIREWRRSTARLPRGESATLAGILRRAFMDRLDRDRLSKLETWESTRRLSHLNEIVQLFPEWPSPYLSVSHENRRKRLELGSFPYLWDFQGESATLMDVTEWVTYLSRFAAKVDEEASAEESSDSNRLSAKRPIIPWLNARESEIRSEIRYFVFAIDFESSRRRAREDFKAWCGRDKRFSKNSASSKPGRKKLGPVEALKHLAMHRALERSPGAPSKAVHLLERNQFPWREKSGKTNLAASVRDGENRYQENLSMLFLG